jgi:hypothetical protein
MFVFFCLFYFYLFMYINLNIGGFYIYIYIYILYLDNVNKEEAEYVDCTLLIPIFCDVEHK